MRSRQWTASPPHGERPPALLSQPLLRLRQPCISAAAQSARAALVAAAIGLLLGSAGLAGCVSLRGDDLTLRTPGEVIEDERIERLARQRIKASDGRLATSNVNVQSYHGIVLLTGQVEEQALRAEAERLVAEVPKVRKTHNEIQVGGATNFVTRANDKLLAAKVGSRFIAREDVDLARIKVVAENGVIYLIGVVERQQADAAAEAARTVFGVRKVVKVFDYPAQQTAGTEP